MKTLQKVGVILALTAIVSFGSLAQDKKDTPEKQKTPGAKVEKKEDVKQPDKNNKDENKDNRNKDRKKPPGEG